MRRRDGLGQWLIELLDRWRRVVIVVLHLPLMMTLNYIAF